MKKYAKRYLSLVLAFTLVFAIPFAFTQEASAASKSKKQTVYLQTKVVSVTKYSTGETYKDTTKNTYNKKGQLTKSVYSSKGYKATTKYKYNKKGYMTSLKEYDKKNKLTYQVTVKMNKKGMPAKRISYDVNGKKKKKTYVETYKYSGKKLVKISWKDYTDNSTGSYDPNAPITQDNVNYKYDNHGNIIEENNTDSYTEDGVTYTTVSKTVYSYTYNKAGAITKSSSTTTSVTTDTNGGKETSTSSNVTTYKLKKMKVASKYLNSGF